MAPEAVPFLLDWITSERPAWKDKLLEQIVKVPGLPVLKMTSITPVFGSLLFEDNPSLGVLGFRVLGSNAAPAVPALTKLMFHTNRSIRANAWFALRCIGQEGLPAYIAALTNASPPYRISAAMQIGRMTEDAVDLSVAVPPLVHALDDSDWSVAVSAAQSLGEIRLRPDLSIPALHKALDHPNAELRVRAAEALARFPDQRELVVSRLQAMLRDLSTKDFNEGSAEGSDALSYGELQVLAMVSLRELTNAPSR